MVKGEQIEYSNKGKQLVEICDQCTWYHSGELSKKYNFPQMILLKNESITFGNIVERGMKWLTLRTKQNMLQGFRSNYFLNVS